MASWRVVFLISVLSFYEGYSARTSEDNSLDKTAEVAEAAPCTCGIFLSGQFVRGSKLPPKGNPALLQEIDSSFPNNAVGNRQCMNKCLEMVRGLLSKHLAHSAELICATMGRDCYKERAYLFVKNHNANWSNTNLSAGREFCCKDNEPYKCSQGRL